jgi:hypothetical protein
MQRMQEAHVAAPGWGNTAPMQPTSTICGREQALGQWEMEILNS